MGGITAENTETKATITTEIKGIANDSNKRKRVIGIAITLNTFRQRFPSTSWRSLLRRFLCK